MSNDCSVCRFAWKKFSYYERPIYKANKDIKQFFKSNEPSYIRCIKVELKL